MKSKNLINQKNLQRFIENNKIVCNSASNLWMVNPFRIKMPNGDHIKIPNLLEARKLGNFYFPKIIKPWLENFIKPYKIIKTQFYLRGFLLYWGAIITL